MRNSVNFTLFRPERKDLIFFPSGTTLGNNSDFEMRNSQSVYVFKQSIRNCFDIQTYNICFLIIQFIGIL